MEHRASASFWKAYEALPPEVRKQADKNFELLKNDPKHPSLHFKKVPAGWSARAGLHYRALAIQRPYGFLWYWIGGHDEYERMIRE